MCLHGALTGVGPARVPSRQMLLRVAPPSPPCRVAPRGPPSPCFQRSLHSCHLLLSVGKSSSHEVIHMEHHICRIFILTRVRASSGCRQSLSLTHRQLEWGFLPREQRGRQRARWAAHTRGAGLGDPSLLPKAPEGPPSVLWSWGSAVPPSLDLPHHHSC